MSSGVVKADSLFQSASYNGVTDWTKTFTFNQFDPSLGSLYSVTITSQETLNTGGTVTNDSASLQTFTFQEEFQALLNAPSGSPGGTNLTSLASLPSTPFTLASGASGSYGPFNFQAGSLGSITFTGSSDLAIYTGTGTVNFVGQTLGGEQINGGGLNITASLSSTASDLVTVRYDYSTVPEPLSLSLSGAGLVLLGVFGRKRLARGR